MQVWLLHKVLKLTRSCIFLKLAPLPRTARGNGGLTDRCVHLFAIEEYFISLGFKPVNLLYLLRRPLSDNPNSLDALTQE